MCVLRIDTIADLECLGGVETAIRLRVPVSGLHSTLHSVWSVAVNLCPVTVEARPWFAFGSAQGFEDSNSILLQLEFD